MGWGRCGIVSNDVANLRIMQELGKLFHDFISSADEMKMDCGRKKIRLRTKFISTADEIRG